MKLDRSSPVLETLAALYEKSVPGTTGTGARDFGIAYLRLLREADCTRGDRLTVAENDLRLGRQWDALEIRADHRSHVWQRIRVPFRCEERLFRIIGRTPPAAEREAWAALFEQAASWPVPKVHESNWRAFCHARAGQARAGGPWRPFRRERRARAAQHLELTTRLLGWERPCLLRTASKRLGVDSKFLEASAGTLQTLLSEASAGAIASLSDLGIDHSPTVVRFHGPLRIALRGQVTDYAAHTGESVLSSADLAAAESLEFSAPRCVTVENATTFHELSRLRCGDLFVHTSYPGKTTVEFLRRFPPDRPIHHFGDTDPWGFDVLASLRRALDRPVEPLHMRYWPRPESAPLTPRARRKLDALLRDPLLADVRPELQCMADAGVEGDFEQEGLPIDLPGFPYASPSDGLVLQSEP